MTDRKAGSVRVHWLKVAENAFYITELCLPICSCSFRSILLLVLGFVYLAVDLAGSKELVVRADTDGFSVVEDYYLYPRCVLDDVRCETMKTVGLYGRFLRAFLRAASVAKSSADALSSRMSISGRLTSARALCLSLCF